MARAARVHRRRTRAELAALPHGVYEAEGFVDTTATPTSRCGCGPASRSAPTGSPSTSTGSDPQRRAPVNSTFAQTFSACAYALKCLIDPDLPVNDGFYRLVGSSRRAAALTNCTWPSPVVGGWETQTRLIDLIFRALLPRCPSGSPRGRRR